MSIETIITETNADLELQATIESIQSGTREQKKTGERLLRYGE